MNFDSFKWINESTSEYKGGVLTLQAMDNTDYFNSPVKETASSPSLFSTLPCTTQSSPAILFSKPAALWNS